MRSIQRGSLLIGLILAAAVTVSLASVWYAAAQQRRCLALWGTEASRLMRHGSAVRVWRVSARSPDRGERFDDASGLEPIEFRDQRLYLHDAREITGANGLSHVRQALTHDRMFDWNAPTPESAPTWRFALQFIDAGQSATVLLAFDVPTAGLLESGAAASISPAASAFEEFLLEQFEDRPGAAAP